MSLLSLIFVLIVVGVILGLVPMDGTVKKILLAVVIIAVVLVLFDLIGGLGGSGTAWHLRSPFGR